VVEASLAAWNRYSGLDWERVEGTAEPDRAVAMLFRCTVDAVRPVDSLRTSPLRVSVPNSAAQGGIGQVHNHTFSNAKCFFCASTELTFSPTRRPPPSTPVLFVRPCGTREQHFRGGGVLVVVTANLAGFRLHCFRSTLLETPR
jgi:hypothetical protein